jgi:hypothetical protein
MRGSSEPIVHRHRLPVALVLLFVSACATENTLQTEKEEPTGLEEAEDPAPPIDADTATDDRPDTGFEELPVYCDDRNFRAEPVAQDAECDGGPVSPDWSLEVLWETTIGSGTYSPLVVGQLDDDDGDGDVDDADIPDVIAFDTSAVMYSIRGSDGTVNWQRSIVNSVNTLSAIGDVNADGFPDIVTDINYTLTAIDGSTGATIWTGPSSSSKNKGTCGANGMADLDGDGSPEVYLGSLIVDGTTGVTRGNGTEGDGFGVGNSYGHSIAVDLDDDGTREVIVGNAAYDADGVTLWSTGGTDGTPAVADLDWDGSPEIVTVGNYGVLTFDAEGEELWTYDLGGASASTPVLADVDGDMFPDVIIPTTTSLIVLDGDGNERWVYTPSSSGTGRGGASAYDLDGNGTWEIIWAGPGATRILSGDGELLAEYTGTNTSCAGPVPIVDLDGDGHAEIVVVDSSGRVRALRDTAGFTEARPVWHQSDYSLTNVEDNSQLPAASTPNWQGANNFRAGEGIATVVSVYPVIRDVCSDECGDGTVWIWYSIANNGWYDVSEILSLEFWGQTATGMVLLGTDTWTGNVDAGMMTASDFVELTGVPTPMQDIMVRIAGSVDPEFADCSTEDDSTMWNLEVCP